MKHADLTERIIAAFYKVYNTLGWGFLEKVYHNALRHELQKRGMSVATNQRIDVFYDGVGVGEYFADLIVDGVVTLELKAVEQLIDEHEAQLVNYLKATEVEVGLLLNFGPKPQIKRKIFETARRSRTPPPTESE